MVRRRHRLQARGHGRGREPAGPRAALRDATRFRPSARRAGAHRAGLSRCRGRGGSPTSWRATGRTTDLLAERLGLGDDVRQSLRESYERWDGKGAGGLVGEQIRLTSRVVYLADVVAAFERHGGRDQAVSGRTRAKRHRVRPGAQRAVLRARAGPARRARCAEPLVDGARLRTRPRGDRRRTAARRRPRGHRRLHRPQVAVLHRALAHGCRPRRGCRRAVGLNADRGHVRTPRRARARLRTTRCLQQHLGQGRTVERERDGAGAIPSLPDRADARLHPAAGRAGRHRRAAPRAAGRLGIPARLSGNAISLQGRVLAAADCYSTMLEQRPHRPAARPQGRSSRPARLGPRGQARRRGGRSGPPRRRPPGAGTARPPGRADQSRRSRCSGCSTLGLSNRAIAERLTISHKTAGSHIEHIYAKTGANNRATAGLFAMQHGLMSDHGG